MSSRKNAETVIINGVNLIDPSGKSGAQYKKRFASMTDKEFDAYMVAIEEERDYVSMNLPNLTKSGITTANNLKVAETLKYKFFHRLWLTDGVTGQQYLTNHEYLVIQLPLRRQIQTLENKISIPEDNKHVDELTDQPRGVSKGSSCSFPEVLVLYGQNMPAGITELMKYRGGDLKAMNAVDRSLIATGGASMDAFKVHGTKTKSTVTLNVLLKSMHLDNNF